MNDPNFKASELRIYIIFTFVSCITYIFSAGYLYWPFYSFSFCYLFLRYFSCFLFTVLLFDWFENLKGIMQSEQFMKVIKREEKVNLPFILTLVN